MYVGIDVQWFLWNDERYLTFIVFCSRGAGSAALAPASDVLLVDAVAVLPVEVEHEANRVLNQTKTAAFKIDLIKLISIHTYVGSLVSYWCYTCWWCSFRKHRDCTEYRRLLVCLVLQVWQHPSASSWTSSGGQSSGSGAQEDVSPLNIICV